MKRHKPLCRKTPLAKMSAKRKAESAIYRRKRALFLALHQVCEWPMCHNYSTDVHHVAGRGKQYLNTETWRAVCRRCHTFIEDHKKLARKLGWITYR